MKKRILCLLLAAVFLSAGGGIVRAADAQPAPAPESDGTAPAESDAPEGATALPETLLEPGEVEQLITEYLQKNSIPEDRIAIAFCYTGTGETWYLNPDRYINGASHYKLSLMMGLARKVYRGELRQDDQINGMDISYIENRSLTYSDNEVSEQIILYFNPFRSYRLMQAEIAGIPEEELPEEYFSSNSFSVRFMMGVLKELYDHTEQYPNVIENLRIANPEHYFRLYLEGRYDIDQKYGGGDGYLHTAGIIRTPTPVLLVVMTYRVTNAEYVIGDLAEMAAELSLRLDQRRDDLLAAAEAERLAAEKAAEEARLAEEKAAEEAERLAREAAEEQARLAAEADVSPVLPSPTVSPPSAAPAPAAADLSSMIYLLGGLAALLAALVVIAVFRRTRKTR